MKHCPKLKEWFQHIPLTLLLHPLGHLSCSDNCWLRQAWECINHKQAVLQYLRKAAFLYCSSSVREARLRTARIYRWNSSILSHHHNYLLVLQKHLNATNSQQSPSTPHLAQLAVLSLWHFQSGEQRRDSNSDDKKCVFTECSLSSAKTEHTGQ